MSFRFGVEAMHFARLRGALCPARTSGAFTGCPPLVYRGTAQRRGAAQALFSWARKRTALNGTRARGKDPRMRSRRCMAAANERNVRMSGRQTLSRRGKAGQRPKRQLLMRRRQAWTRVTKRATAKARLPLPLRRASQPTDSERSCAADGRLTAPPGGLADVHKSIMQQFRQTEPKPSRAQFPDAK